MDMQHKHPQFTTEPIELTPEQEATLQELTEIIDKIDPLAKRYFKLWGEAHDILPVQLMNMVGILFIGSAVKVTDHAAHPSESVIDTAVSTTMYLMKAFGEILSGDRNTGISLIQGCQKGLLGGDIGALLDKMMGDIAPRFPRKQKPEDIN